MGFRKTLSKGRWLLNLTVASLGVSCVGCQIAADGQNVNGVRLYQQGQYMPALQQFQRVLAADPSNADAYYNTAATYHRIGSQNEDRASLDQAETLYNQCLDLDEGHTDCYRGLAVLLAETDRTDASKRLLKNWSSKQPKNAEARVELARLYHESRDYETAKLHLNEALVLDQHNHRAWAALGRIREELEEYDQALANYQRSYNLNQFQPGVAQRIAALNQRRGSTLNVTTPPTRTRTVTRDGVRY